MYLIYFSANTITLFVPKQHFFLLLLSSGEFMFLLYANRKIKYQIHYAKMIMKRNLEDTDDKPEDHSQILDYSINLIRRRIILKNAITMTISAVLALIIFYSNGILKTLTILCIVILWVYHYNTQKINPQDIKDSMKYDRQKVDLDGGLAVSQTNFSDHRRMRG